jgi:mannosyltransferase
MTPVDAAALQVIAPNLKRRLSGVTATVHTLVPLQAREIAIAATGPALPAHIPQIALGRLLSLPSRTPRVWHARRNVEMIAGLALRHLGRKRLRLLFTSASQRDHSWLSRWLINRMDAVVAVSGKSASYLTVPHRVIRHGIDTQKFQPAADRSALRARLGLPGETLLVGCYGRVRAQKGTGDFVDAMVRLLPDRPHVTAVVMGGVVGHEDYAGALKDQIASAGLSDRILMLPEVPVEAMGNWYAALDLYVAPQRWEGFGLTVLEAMSTGVPVVATRVGAFEELMADGVTGHLIPPEDVDAMAGAVASFLDAPNALTAMAKAARPHVLENFPIEGEAQALVALYREMLDDA